MATEASFPRLEWQQRHLVMERWAENHKVLLMPIPSTSDFPLLNYPYFFTFKSLISPTFGSLIIIFPAISGLGPRLGVLYLPSASPYMHRLIRHLCASNIPPLFIITINSQFKDLILLKLDSDKLFWFFSTDILWWWWWEGGWVGYGIK